MTTAEREPHVCEFPAPADCKNGQRWTCPDCTRTYWCHKRLWRNAYQRWNRYQGHWELFPPWWMGGIFAQHAIGVAGLFLVAIGILLAISAFHFGGRMINYGIDVAVLGVACGALSAITVAVRAGARFDR